MTEVDNRKDQAFGWVLAVAKVMGAASLILTTAYAILLGAISLGETELRDFAVRLTGSNINAERLERMSDDIANVATSISAMQRTIESVHPPVVAEFDTVRSGVYDEDGTPGVCTRSVVCEARYLARRTGASDGCRAPDLRRFVTLDRDARAMPVTVVDDTALSQILSIGNYEWRSLYFTLAHRAPPGLSEVIVEVDHSCSGKTIQTRLPPLLFDIKE